MSSKFSLFFIIAASCLFIQVHAMDSDQPRNRKARSKNQQPIDYVRLSVLRAQKDAEKAKAREVVVPKFLGN